MAQATADTGALPLTLGERLRVARETHRRRTGVKLEQEDMARHFGVSRVAVSNWENDRNLPADVAAVCRQWAEVTGTSLAWLYFGADTARTRRQAVELATLLDEQETLSGKLAKLQPVGSPDFPSGGDRRRADLRKPPSRWTAVPAGDGSLARASGF